MGEIKFGFTWVVQWSPKFNWSPPMAITQVGTSYTWLIQLVSP
jgi:hypothetical protein